MLIKTIEQLHDLSQSKVEIIVSQVGSRYHWVRKTSSIYFNDIQQGFSTTLLSAIFESEI